MSQYPELDEVANTIGADLNKLLPGWVQLAAAVHPMQPNRLLAHTFVSFAVNLMVTNERGWAKEDFLRSCALIYDETYANIEKFRDDQRKKLENN